MLRVHISPQAKPLRRVDVAISQRERCSARSLVDFGPLKGSAPAVTTGPSARLEKTSQQAQPSLDHATRADSEQAWAVSRLGEGPSAPRGPRPPRGHFRPY
jgi:hypothetical protein